MNKKNKLKAIVAIAVALAFLVPTSTVFAIDGTIGVTSNSENNSDMESMVETSTNSDTIDEEQLVVEPTMDTSAIDEGRPGTKYERPARPVIEYERREKPVIETDFNTILSRTAITIYVDDDADPGWYDETHVETVQEGVDVASEEGGDTVYVYNGVYYENVVIEAKQLFLIGESKENTIVDGNGEDAAVSIFVSNGVEMESFTARNGDWTCVFIAESFWVNISNCTFYNAEMGVYTEVTEECTFTNILSYQIEVGIYICEDVGSIITNCSSSPPAYDSDLYPIIIEVGEACEIRDCTFSNDDEVEDIYGILLVECVEVIVENCDFSNVGFAIAVEVIEGCEIIECNIFDSGDAIYIEDESFGNSITNCNIYNNINGIFLYGAEENIIADCTVYNNTMGINFQYSANNTLEGNTIYDNGGNLNVYGNMIHHYYQYIDASNTVNGDPVLYLIGEENVEIDGFTLANIGYLGLISCTNIKVENLDTNGIVIANTSGVLISNVSSHNGGYGVLLYSCTVGTITNSTFYDSCEQGIRLYLCADFIITNCDSYNNFYGVSISKTPRTIVTNCTFSDNYWYGIQIAGLSGTADNTVITNCDFYENRHGIHVYYSPVNTVIVDCTFRYNHGFGIWEYKSTNTEVNNCTFYNNSDPPPWGDPEHCAAGYYGTYDSVSLVTECTFYNNRHGIWLYHAGATDVLNCDVYNNVVGVWIGYCVGATLQDVSIYDNEIHLKVSGTVVSEYTSTYIDTSNTINGKPIYYLKGQSDLEFNETHEVGFLGLISCSRITVKNLDICGVLMVDTVDSVLTNVVTHNSGIGVLLSWYSTGNIVQNCAIHSNEYGVKFHRYSSNNVIANCSIYNHMWRGIETSQYSFGYAIHAYLSLNNITNCNVYNNTRGIYLTDSSSSNITDCDVYNNTFGIYFKRSAPHMLRGVTLYDNTNSFYLEGRSVDHFIHDIDVSNTIDGKRMYYFVGDSDNIIDGSVYDFGYLGLVSCTNITAINADVCGMVVVDTINSTISNVVVSDTYDGIFIYGSSNNNFIDCTSYNNDNMGIWLYTACYNNNFIDCTTYNNEYAGIDNRESHNNNFINCTSYSNGKNNFHIHRGSSGCDIIDCTVYDASIRSGIQISESIDIDVTNCDIFNNNAEGGIYIWDSPDCDITNCSIYNNEIGIELACCVYNSVVYHNNFINNVVQGVDQEKSSQWDNDYPSGGNYWDDYTGVDEYSGPDQDIPGSDGIGDTPHTIGGNQDNYPLMAPIGDTTSPMITGVVVTTSDPLDTDVPYGWENVTCTVIDFEVRDVKLVVTDPDAVTTEYPMTKNGDEYYYETTFTIEGCYEYHVWADDTSDNEATSSPQQFELPPNEDVDLNGQIHFMDLVAIVIIYGDYGPNGWVREDVDNNGQAHFMDLVAIVLRYGEYWDQC